LADGSIFKLTMPKWGLSMAQGKVVAWIVPEGAEISLGAELVEIESEKTTGVVEAPIAGVLRRQVAQADQVVPVGGLLAVLANAAVPEEQIDAFVRDFATKVDSDEDPAKQAVPQSVNVAGRTLRYLKLGDGSDPALLIHGFTGDLNNWLFNHGPLAAQRAVYAVDLPGHGQSSKDVGQGSLVELTGVVSQWMETLELPRVHVIGHSLGGVIALALAIKRPEQILSCTLLAPAGLGEEIDGEYLEGVVTAERRKELTTHLQKLFADSTRVSRQLVDDMLKYKRLDGVRIALRAILDHMIVDGRQAIMMRDQLQQLQIPTLILWGREDRIIPVSHSSNLPESVSVHVFEDCGHMVQMEAANDVNRIISRFLERQA